MAAKTIFQENEAIMHTYSPCIIKTPHVYLKYTSGDIMSLYADENAYYIGYDTGYSADVWYLPQSKYVILTYRNGTMVNGLPFMDHYLLTNEILRELSLIKALFK